MDLFILLGWWSKFWHRERSGPLDLFAPLNQNGWHRF
jgi:hypothetical protein